MKTPYPSLNTDYYCHDGTIRGPVRVLHIGNVYHSNEECVIFQGVHTHKIGIILLSQWDEPINIDDRPGCMDERPRFYSNSLNTS